METNGPYLTPQPHRGKRNEPSYVVHTARKIDEVKGVPFAEVATVTSQNARAVFSMK